MCNEARKPQLASSCPPDDWDAGQAQPCAMCGGPNDVGELCSRCAKGSDPFGGDLEASGGWMVQDGR